MKLRHATIKQRSIIFGAFFILALVIGQYIGGSTLLSLFDLPLDSLTFLTLWQYVYHYHSEVSLQNKLMIAWGISMILPFSTLLIIMGMLWSFTKEELHGSARFANDDDLQKSGLFPSPPTEKTILLGKMHKGRFNDRFVELEGQTFVSLEAPTGSGKGVGFVLPNGVSYSDSMVFVDVKLENFLKTAGFRASMGQSIYVFSPDGYSATEEEGIAGVVRSHRWNPFYYVRRSESFRIGDLLILSTSLYPLKGDKDIWPASAGKLFTGLSLWMLDTENITGIVPTIPYMLDIAGVDGGLTHWMKSELDKGYLSQECKNEFNAFLSYPHETQGSILANFFSPLAIFADKTVAKSVSGNDFDFNDLRKKGISLYIGIRPPNLPRFQKMLNLFFEQLISVNTRVMPEQDASLTHQCLLMLDEFPALGKVQQIATSIGYTRQYDLRYAIIIQSYAQLVEIYGKEVADNIMKNMVAEIFFPPKKVDKRVEEISTTLGTKTVREKGDSRTQGKNSSKTLNTSSQKRSLMYPHEIVELGLKMHPKAPIGTDVILIKENARPFIMKKLISFEEPEILRRIEFSLANVPTIPLL